MGGTPHWRRARVEANRLREEVTAAERERCAAIVEAWNAHPTCDWSPALGTALKAGHRWLAVYCPGCHQVSDVDLEALDRHPFTCLTGLIFALACRSCGERGPLPMLKGVSRFRADPITSVASSGRV